MDQSSSAFKPHKTLFELCFPLLLHALLSFSVVMIDMLIISSYSQQAAAAVSMANQILLVAYEFSILLGVGGVIVIARSLGSGDYNYARYVAKITIIGNAGFSFLMSIGLVLLAPLLLKLINTPTELYRDAWLYTAICGSTLMLNGIMLAGIHVLKGFGLTRTLLLISIFSQVFYLLLEYVLILGWGPFQGYGVLGSALGTFIMRLVASLLLILIIARVIKLSWLATINWQRSFLLIKRLFKLSFPSVSDNIAYGFYQLVIIGFIASLGVATILSRTYTMIANSFLTLLIMVISQGNEVILGYKTGAEESNYNIFWQAIHSLLIAVLISTSVAIILYNFAEPFFQLFTQDPQTIALGKQLFWVNIFLQPVFAANAILLHSLKAVGHVNKPVIISQLLTWLISLPLAYVVCLPLGYGIVGVWWVMVFEESLKTLTMFYLWWQKPWLVYSKNIL